MLRRSSRFNGEFYPTIILAESENYLTLEQKWRQLVDAESFKRYVVEPKCNNVETLIRSRMVYHMFIHDVQASMLPCFYSLILLCRMSSSICHFHHVDNCGRKDSHGLEDVVSREDNQSPRATTISHIIYT